MVSTLLEAIGPVRDALSDVSRGLVEREALVETIALAAVAGEHVLVVGPPGTAKSEAVRRGHTTVYCPLRVCVGASNALPDDESLAAFVDRFLVRVFVEPVPDARLEDLLE